MNNGKISTRYAKALLSSAKEKKIEDTIYKEICILNQLFDAHPELSQLLANPTVTSAEKIVLLQELIGKRSPELADFVAFVVKQKRENYLHLITLMFEVIYRKEKNMLISTVTSAIEMPKGTLKKITASIEKTNKAKVELRTEVDPELIGGYILDIENSRLDASVKGQLSKLYKHAGH